MRDAGFLLFGCQVFTSLPDLDHIDKVDDRQREAVLKAMYELSNRRLKPEILIITKAQVVALPDLEYDLLDHIAVADIRGIMFLSRGNRTGLGDKL